MKSSTGIVMGRVFLFCLMSLAARHATAATVLSTAGETCIGTTFSFALSCSSSSAGGPYGFGDTAVSGSFGGVDYFTTPPQPIVDYESSVTNPVDVLTFTSAGTVTGVTAPVGTTVPFAWSFLLNLLTANQFGGGTGSITGLYSVTYDIYLTSAGEATGSVFGGPVTFGTFANAPSNTGSGSRATTAAIVAGQSYTTSVTLSSSFTRTGGTPGLGVKGDFLVGAPEPASLALVASSLGLIVLRLRRRRND